MNCLKAYIDIACAINETTPWNLNLTGIATALGYSSSAAAVAMTPFDPTLTRCKAMINFDAYHANQAEVDYICIAGDLLRRMMSELQSAVAGNARLALSMATAGHDLRQRLHSLLSTIELLSLADSPARAGDLARRAKAMIFRLANELEALALYADGDALPGSPLTHSFEVAPVLEQVHVDWSFEAREKCLGFKITHTAAMVDSDPYLLAVIVNNVVANAVRYTQSGEVCVECDIEDGHLVLKVKDTGPGIPDAVMHRVCVASNNVRSTSTGLGLGLSIVRRTAELLGHSLDFTTGANEGTCVRLRVPLSPSSAHRTAAFDGA
jgi:two-component system, sensor histidine kinase